MYVNLLSGALDLWNPEVDDEALLDHGRDCCAALPTLGTSAPAPIHQGPLAAAISYERRRGCIAAQ